MKNSNTKAITIYMAATLLFLATATKLTAQAAGDSSKPATDHRLYKMELGARFMPTISSFDVRGTDGGVIEGKTVVGYGFGGMLGLNFTENVGMQAEVIYNSFSQKFKDRELERTVTVNYINVPLLLALNTDKTECVNLNFVVGPQIGLNVGSKFESTGSTASESDTITTVLAVRQGDLGFAYGAGLDIALNSARTVRFDFGFRGVYGLIDISNKSQNTTTRSYYLLDRTNIQTYSAYIGLTLLF